MRQQRRALVEMLGVLPLNGACHCTVYLAARSLSWLPSATSCVNGCLKVYSATWSNRFSRSGNRSMRAANTACTVAGTSSRSIGVTRAAMARFDAERTEAAKRAIWASGCKSW